MQLIAFGLVAFVSGAASFLLASALASGAREDAFRAGYRAGMHAASLGLSRIAGGLVSDESEGREDAEVS